MHLRLLKHKVKNAVYRLFLDSVFILLIYTSYAFFVAVNAYHLN